ncbi:uncharacterized protein WCC33_008027 [Rhinophrynus dorsalis]
MESFIMVDFKFKAAFELTNYDKFAWHCGSGDCGSDVQHSYLSVDNNTAFQAWYQSEGYMVRQVTSNKPFYLRADSCCWVKSYNGNYNSWGLWSLQTAVDLGTRSDTSKPNNSPVTTIIPVIRVPMNCPSSFTLLAHDPDGDIVRCRYGNIRSVECGICYQPSQFTLDQNTCILSFSSSLPTYTYAFELVLEDFPNQNIYLTYNDGTSDNLYRPMTRKKRQSDARHYQTTVPAPVSFIDWHTDTTESTYTTESTTEYVTTTRTRIIDRFPPVTEIWGTSHAPPIRTLSKIPLQFLLEVTSKAPTCTFGEYRPKFLPPTPNQGETVVARAGSPLQIHLTAQATHDSITDFKVSGPSQLSKVFTSSSGSITRSMLVQWTPSDNDVGDHVPFCFVAETLHGYQSALRCIIAVVGPSILGNVTLICNENTMTLFITKLPKDDNGWLLDDPQCLVTSNSTHHIASVAYNSCGTKTEETKDYIVFKNRVTSFLNTTEVITRKHLLAIPFNCSFPKKNRLSSLSNAFLPQKAFYEFTEAGFGNFTYKFQFYTDEQFIDIQTQYPLQVWLRDELYMEIQVTSSVPNVQLFVESCRATPHNNPSDPVYYDIIQDGCVKDETVVVYPGTRTRARFGMEAFAFIGNYEEVYLSCTVILCKLGEPSTRCVRGCNNSSLPHANKLRSRRSLRYETQRHFISQGPLSMKKRSFSTGSDTNQSLNVNTLVMSLSGVAVVALFALIMQNYMKTSRITKYEKLPTQDFFCTSDQQP